MSIFRIKGVSVKALACAVPKKNFTLTEYAPDLVDELTARKIGQVSGFTSLRIAPEGMTTADLAAKSAEVILGSYVKNTTGVGGIKSLLFLTQTPDHHIPATAHILQDRLGLPEDILCIDVTEGCSGFITGLYMSSLIALNTGKSVLLCGGDTSSKLQSPSERGTRCIFGDAGYAALISPDSDEEIPFMFTSYGDRAEVIVMDNDAFRITDIPRNDCFTYMDGAEVMKFTLTDVPRVMNSFLCETGIKKEEVDLFACHQANKLMLSSLAKKIGVPEKKLPFTAGGIGNTSSASIPVLLSAYENKADLSCVICAGFGVGLSIGICRLDLSGTKIYGLIEI